MGEAYVAFKHYKRKEKKVMMYRIQSVISCSLSFLDKFTYRKLREQNMGLL